jgi:hypothetical protein
VSQIRREVGRFEIVRELGRGGMAVVYVARQPGLDREVALKELAQFHAEDPAFVDRFLRESRVAGSLAHPNIVTVYDYFEHAGIPYIAMEYLARGSLRPLVGRLPLAQVAGLLEGVLAGLSHAAGRSIVHRDLKPENLLITSEGGIKIADFGIAKALNQASLGAFRTATGMAIGTPAYMAPEQATASEVGSWTDLYAVGVIAYELLVGRVPFGVTDTPMAVLWKHVHEAPPPPLSVRPDLDPGLAGWLDRMLSKSPIDRPASPTEAWEELEEIMIGLLGPRWRRQARIVEQGVEAPTPEPLTPATFHEELTPDAAEAPTDDFDTYASRRAAARPAPQEARQEPPAAPPPPPAVPPVPPEAAPPPAGEPPPPGRPPAPPAPPAPTIPPVPADPGTAAETFAWPETEAAPRVPRWAVPAGVGVVLAALLVAGLLVLVPRIGDGRTATNGATTGQQTTTVADGGDAAFVRLRDGVADLGGAGDQAIRTLIPQEEGALAGGSDGTGEASDGALWRLENGTWTRLAGEALRAEGGQAVTALARSSSALVAVGWNEAAGDRDAAVWASTGGPMTVVCDDAVCGDLAVSGPERRQEMLGVATLAGGFVAVGRDVDPVDRTFDAAAWRSDDGLVWARLALPSEGFAGAGSQAMTDVVATGTGFVAVGRDGLDAAVWRSEDGTEWERVRSDALTAAGAQEMLAVVASDAGLIAVGYDERGGELGRDAAVWLFDGDWRRVSADELEAPGGQEMRAVARVGGAFVAGGFDRASGDSDAAVWTSSDAVLWRPVAADELGGAGDQAVNALLGLPGGAALAAGDAPAPGSSAGQDAAAWSRG